MSDEAAKFDFTNFAILLDSLHHTPVEVAQFVKGLSRAELVFKNSADEFSVLENICHLRDLELAGYTPRIRRMRDEIDPLADFDGARVAAESNYNSEDEDLALQAFDTARRENIEILKSLTEAQLQREGTLAGVGKITLARLVEMMGEHDAGHIEDLRVLRQRLERERSLEG